MISAQQVVLNCAEESDFPMVMPSFPMTIARMTHQAHLGYTDMRLASVDSIFYL